MATCARRLIERLIAYFLQIAKRIESGIENKYIEYVKSLFWFAKNAQFPGD
jgi:hypothetical protein